MKLTYKTQMIAALVIILLANVLGSIFKHWGFRSAGFVVCGLLWIVHPVLPNGAEISKRSLSWVRIAGVILILIGVFTRA